MKKSWFLLVIATCMVVFTVGCWLFISSKKSVQQAGNGAEIILRLGHGGNLTSTRHLISEKYADWVFEQTNGKVKIEIYPDEVLGSDKQMTELVLDGTLDMTITLHGMGAAYAPKLAAIELPFLFSSIDKVDQFLNSPLAEELAADMPQKGLRLLAYWDNGLRQISTNKKPIEKPADLTGLKFRTPESQMTISIFKALGANPAPLGWNELYLALAQGAFDGQENPTANIHMGKLYEVQKYLSLTNHKYESNPLLINEQAWQKLPPDMQRIIKEGAVKFAAEQRHANAEAENKYLADLTAKGMIITRPDIEPFRIATKPVYDEFEAVIGKELLNKIIAAAK